MILVLSELKRNKNNSFEHKSAIFKVFRAQKLSQWTSFWAQMVTGICRLLAQKPDIIGERYYFKFYLAVYVHDHLSVNTK